MSFNSTDRVLARVVNDTRNAMHGLLGLFDLIANDQLTEAQRDYLTLCRNNSDRLLRTLDDAARLAFDAQVEVPRRSEQFSLAEFVDDVVLVARCLGARKQIDVRSEVDPGLPAAVEGQRELMDEVLMRLLDNAVKFTAVGEVVLKVSPESNGVVRFEVLDTGPGITLSHAGSFESGVFPDSSSLDIPAGFGLPIVGQIVTALSGTLDIANRTGGGCRVSVCLPLHASSAPPKKRYVQSIQSASAPQLSNLRVLAAEDSDDSYDLLWLMLSGCCSRLDRAWNGEEAVRKAQDAEYDLILMDIHMPVLDGYAATYQIRLWETAKSRIHVPIIVLSADPIERQKRRGGVVGCSGYLAKPVDRSSLMQTIAHFVNPNETVRSCSLS